MLMQPAVEADFPATVELANRAYRGGPGAVQSWNVEAGIVAGQRLSDALLREELAAKPDAFLLTARDTADGPLLGTVWLHPRERRHVIPGLADGAAGAAKPRPGAGTAAPCRGVCARPGSAAHAHGGGVGTGRADRVVRAAGIPADWGTQPFPYGDERFGKPLRDDLHFVVMEKDLA